MNARSVASGAQWHGDSLCFGKVDTPFISENLTEYYFLSLELSSDRWPCPLHDILPAMSMHILLTLRP
jgi:hypothetical protein